MPRPPSSTVGVLSVPLLLAGLLAVLYWQYWQQQQQQQQEEEQEAGCGTRSRPRPRSSSSESAYGAFMDGSSTSSTSSSSSSEESDTESGGWERIESDAMRDSDGITSLPASAVAPRRCRATGTPTPARPGTAATASDSATALASAVPPSARSLRGSDRQHGVCCVCREAPSCVLYLPCRHVCACEACASRIDSGEAVDNTSSNGGGDPVWREPPAAAPSRAAAAAAPDAAPPPPSLLDTVLDSVLDLAAGIFGVAGEVSTTTAARPAVPCRPRCPICNVAYTERCSVYVS